MRTLAKLAWICLAVLVRPAHADDISGPYRTTIKAYTWGSVYYDPAQLGECQLEPTHDGFRFTSAEGEVVIRGNDFTGFQIRSADDVLTIRQNMGDLEVRGPNVGYTFRTFQGRLVLTSQAPKDTLQFDRGINAFSISGAKGKVSVSTSYGNLRIDSPLGTTTVTNAYGKLTFTGPALGRIPYLGRGIFIPFHGVGVFLDVTRQFPMPEIGGWLEWRPVLAP
jgi:hypothetical protein